MKGNIRMLDNSAKLNNRIKADNISMRILGYKKKQIIWEECKSKFEAIRVF